MGWISAAIAKFTGTTDNANQKYVVAWKLCRSKAQAALVAEKGILLPDYILGVIDKGMNS
jgi:hypothetical protein